MAFTGTPAAEAVEAIVRLLFEERFTHVGQYKRRPISGSTTWSQHSWGNALDIHVSVGTAVGAEKVNGDAIHDFLYANKAKFGIRYLLWWRKDHYNHIHVDFWPKGALTPPETSTGIGTFQYSNGTKVEIQNQLVPAEGDFSDYDYEGAQVKELVTFIQTALVEAGFDPGPIDGVLGPQTQAGLVAALVASGGGMDQDARNLAAMAGGSAEAAHERLDAVKAAL